MTGMLGRPVSRDYPEKRLPPADAPVVLDVAGLTAPGVVDATLDAARRRDRGPRRAHRRRAFRARPRRSTGRTRRRPARSRVARHRPSPGRPAASIAAGVALIPESRKDDGLILRRPIRENVSLTSLGRFQRLGFVRRGTERAAGPRCTRTGGRVVAARVVGGLVVGWQPAEAAVRPRAARSDRTCCWPMSRHAASTSARSATSTTCWSDWPRTGWRSCSISNEVEEILGLAHRVLVMRAGRLVAELSGADMTEEGIVSAAFGTTGDERRMSANTVGTETAATTAAVPACSRGSWRGPGSSSRS